MRIIDKYGVLKTESIDQAAECPSMKKILRVGKERNPTEDEKVAVLTAHAAVEIKIAQR